VDLNLMTVEKPPVVPNNHTRMSELHLFNTLTRTLEKFEPLEPGHVRMYSCGPTVYNYIHIGNLRTFLWCDLLRRYLEWKRFRVTMVMNLTDIEDKIIRSAAAQGSDIYTYVAPYIDAFFEDLAAVRIRRADLHPKATDHIDEMVEIVRKLRERGHTYEADGSTYFKISTLPGYGRLARLELQSGDSQSRIESDEYEKEDARDFVLWKGKKEGEPSWATEIGEGRPGWHLECSAMAMKYLGETFDLHTGAVDLIFPHHENEIAQSEGATGKQFVRYWVHGEHLNVDQQKMSKSLGNIHTLRELLGEGYSPLQVRYALLSVPYRTKLNFTMKSLEDAAGALERLETFMQRLAEGGEHEEPTARGTILRDDFLREFEAAMDDDLNTAGALGALFRLVREGNIGMDGGELSLGDRRAIAAAIESVDAVLDLLPRRDEEADAGIDPLIKARDEARARRDFRESDRLRDELTVRGIVIEDTPAGTRWRKKIPE
jgi:cysteinyl-tRNA synthetase